jgi:cytochrome P450
MPTFPPGPTSQVSSIYHYVRDPIGCMVPFVKKYGDPFTLAGEPRTVVTGDPAGLKAIYSADPDTFAPMNQDMSVFLGKHAMILQSGTEHKRSRRLMMPPFHGQRMRVFGETMCSLAQELTDDWTEGREVVTYDVAQRISLDVIIKVIFGVRDPAQKEALAKGMIDLLNGISPLAVMIPALRREFGGIGPFASFRRMQRAVYDNLETLIRNAREAGSNNDILSLLIDARYEGDQPLSDEEIRDQLVLMVVAGHETTGISLAWALYALHRPENAAALEKLRAELETLPKEPDIAAMDKLPYLEAVCQETLRRYPIAPAPSPRKLLRPMELMGYSLPEGAGVSAAIGVVHFREDLYPDPWQFKPERFLERKFSPFEYIPFGGGARRCLGAAMASYEMRLVLGTIMKRFRLRLSSLKPDNGKVRAANVGPASGVKMVVEKRLF